MAKFIYNMENILSIKLKLEDQAKSAFSEAKRLLDKEELKMIRLNKKKSHYEQILVGNMEDILDVREIKRCQDAIEILKYDIRIQLISVNSARQQVELARIKLNEAMVERKIHEKLKEKAFEDFKNDLKVEEQKEVDELVSFTYTRKKQHRNEE